MILASTLIDQIQVLRGAVNARGTLDFNANTPCIAARVEQVSDRSVDDGAEGRQTPADIKIFTLPNEDIRNEDLIQFEEKRYKVIRVFKRKSLTGPHHIQAEAVLE